MSKLGKFSLKPLSIVDDDYGSSVLESVSGLNPLIAASAALLSLAIRLQKVSTLDDPQVLQEKLQTELKHFAGKARELKYSNEIVLAAREIICVFLDGIIAYINFDQAAWQDGCLLKAFSLQAEEEKLSHERLFAILEKTYRDARSNIDLLELIYLCLSLGFLGGELDAEDVVLVESVREDLYHFICEERGELSKSLLIANDSKPNKPQRKIFGRWLRFVVLPPPIWVSALVALFFIFGLYFFSDTRVSTHLTTITENINF